MTYNSYVLTHFLAEVGGTTSLPVERDVLRQYCFVHSADFFTSRESSSLYRCEATSFLRTSFDFLSILVYTPIIHLSIICTFPSNSDSILLQVSPSILSRNDFWFISLCSVEQHFQVFDLLPYDVFDFFEVRLEIHTLRSPLFRLAVPLPWSSTYQKIRFNSLNLKWGSFDSLVIRPLVHKRKSF